MKCLLFYVLLSICGCFYANGQETGCFQTDSNNQLYCAGLEGFKNYNSFLVGEIHDDTATPGIKLALIRYFYKCKGITSVFMEIGYSAALLYNRFLETGDTRYISGPDLVYASTPEGKKFWMDLYEYNKNITKKITIYGVDFERMEFLKAIRILSPKDRDKPVGIKAMLDFADTVLLERVNTDTLNRIYDRYRHDFKTNETEYQAFFGKDFDQVSRILNNRNTYENYNNRNRTMFHNWKQQMKQGRIENFVFFVGAKHCDKSRPGSLGHRVVRNWRDGGATAVILMDQMFYEKSVNFEMQFENIPDTILITHRASGCKYQLVPASFFEKDGNNALVDFILFLKK